MPDSFVVTSDGFRVSLGELANALIHRVLKDVAWMLQSEMKKEAPFDHGRLAGSIQPPFAVDVDSYGITIGANYWRHVQFGTKPHTITAKGPGEPYDIFPRKPGGVLHFVKGGQDVFCRFVLDHPNPGYLAFKMGGRTIFRHSVKHPGTKANPFIDRAIANTEPRLDSIVERALKEVGL